MKPADLRPGDRLPTSIGTLVVDVHPWENFDPKTPEWDRVYVDVRVDDDRTWRGDPDMLPSATGCDTFQWLGLDPLRYRLGFLPNVDVKVER